MSHLPPYVSSFTATCLSDLLNDVNGFWKKQPTGC